MMTWIVAAWILSSQPALAQTPSAQEGRSVSRPEDFIRAAAGLKGRLPRLSALIGSGLVDFREPERGNVQPEVSRGVQLSVTKVS